VSPLRKTKLVCTVLFLKLCEAIIVHFSGQVQIENILHFDCTKFEDSPRNPSVRLFTHYVGLIC
jgi:hypothetical protein